MKSLSLFLQAAALALCLVLSSGRCSAEDTPGFRRFHDTVSPDGAHVFAWGWGADADKLAELKEWAEGKDTAGDDISNFLADAARGQLVAVIPEHDHFVTSDGRFKRFSGLAVGWSEDSRHALAIYEGRWSDESILWVDAKSRTFSEVLPQLVKAYSAFLKKTAKVEDPGEVSFNLPALLPGGVLVINGRARPQINKPPEYNYRLKFQVKAGGKEPKLTLVGGKKIPEPGGEDKVEDELNAAYKKLVAKLNDAERAALKEKQLQWLKQREAMPESERNFFTRLRTAWLDARAEN